MSFNWRSVLSGTAVIVLFGGMAVSSIIAAANKTTNTRITGEIDAYLDRDATTHGSAPSVYIQFNRGGGTQGCWDRIRLDSIGGYRKWLNSEARQDTARINRIDRAYREALIVNAKNAFGPGYVSCSDAVLASERSDDSKFVFVEKLLREMYSLKMDVPALLSMSDSQIREERLSIARADMLFWKVDPRDHLSGCGAEASGTGCVLYGALLRSGFTNEELLKK